MDRMFRDGSYYGIHSKHKMTTDRQYSLLKSSMSNYFQKNSDKINDYMAPSKYKQDYLHWTELTKKLNKIGPPHRTIQQWKKVWCDHKRAEKKRKSKGKDKSKILHIKKDQNNDNEISESATDEKLTETKTFSDTKINIKSENIDNDQNSQSMYSTYSNEYDNDYSYPDDDSLLDLCYDESVNFIPDESSCGSYNYASRNFNEPTIGRSYDQPVSNNHFSSPPPLQPSNLPLHNQTLYNLQNQMEHQTKLLEHLSQMSSTMTSLMERKVHAVEKQTDVMKRHALATERHTSVMNKFFDMIREKMFKGNSQNTTPTENFSNDIF